MELYKSDFWPYIWQYTSANELFEYVYLHVYVLLSLLILKMFVLSQIGVLQAA